MLGDSIDAAGMTADALNGMIRCPVVLCNDGTGRLLFQLFDSDLPEDTRWYDYLSLLSKEERDRKIEVQEQLRIQSWPRSRHA